MDERISGALYVLYWVALKSKYKSFQDWYDVMIVSGRDGHADPIVAALEMIEEFGVSNKIKFSGE